MRLRLAPLLLPALALPAACRAADDEPEPPPPLVAPGAGEAPAPAAPPAPAWTRAFLEPAVLVAEEIRIEGPPALRDHVAVRQDSLATRYDARTTADGFLQEVASRRGYAEIRAALDAWELVATRRLVWLERPTPGPVLVVATGDATWHRVDGADAREGQTLRFRGSPE